MLLNLQDEIVTLERDLKSVEEDQKANRLERRLESRAKEVRESRKETGKGKMAILSDLESKLMTYGTSVAHQTRFCYMWIC